MNVTELITSFTSFITELTGGNELMATAVIGMIAMQVKGIPTKLYSFLVRNLTVSVILDNGNFHKWQHVNEILNIYKSEYGVRVFNADVISNDEFNAKTELTAGLGTHRFFYKGLPYKVVIIDLESSGTEQNKQRMTITGLGLTSNRLFGLLEDHDKARDRDTQEIRVNTIQSTSSFPVPAICDLPLNENVSTSIINLLDDFNRCDVWKRNNLIKSQMNIMLNGEPGNGKTTLIRSIARHMNRSIEIVDLKDKPLTIVLGEHGWHNQKIFVIEDCHSYDFLLKEEYRKVSGMNLDVSSLSDVLNAADGLTMYKGLVIVFTTNHIDRLEEALIRPGRMQAVIELPRVSPEAVSKYLSETYESNIKVNVSMRACDIGLVIDKCGDDSSLVTPAIEEMSSMIPEKEEFQFTNTNQLKL